MFTSIACSVGGVTHVNFAFRTPNSHSNPAIASRFIIKNDGDGHSPPTRQLVNTRRIPASTGGGSRNLRFPSQRV